MSISLVYLPTTVFLLPERNTCLETRTQCFSIGCHCVTENESKNSVGYLNCTFSAPPVVHCQRSELYTLSSQALVASPLDFCDGELTASWTVRRRETSKRACSVGPPRDRHPWYRPKQARAHAEGNHGAFQSSKNRLDEDIVEL